VLIGDVHPQKNPPAPRHALAAWEKLTGMEPHVDERELLSLLNEVQRTRAEPSAVSSLQAIEERVLAKLRPVLAPHERRDSVRIPCNVEINLRAGGTIKAARLLDLGAGGAFIEADAPAEKGDELAFAPKDLLPDPSNESWISCTVAWSAEPTHHRRGFGVSVKPSASARAEWVHLLIVELARQQPMPEPTDDEY
jgi:hypothetical protein